MFPITVQTLLGLILFSVLLAPGSALKCDTCTGLGESCTGVLETCGAGEDACLSMWLRGTKGGISTDTINKKCIAKSTCADLKSGIAQTVQKIAGPGTEIKKVECSKAPTSSGSLLLALSGLLLLKLLS